MLTIQNLGWENGKDNPFQNDSFYGTTTKNVSHQQLYGLLLKEDSIMLQEELELS